MMTLNFRKRYLKNIEKARGKRVIRKVGIGAGCVVSWISDFEDSSQFELSEFFFSNRLQRNIEEKGKKKKNKLLKQETKNRKRKERKGKGTIADILAQSMNTENKSNKFAQYFQMPASSRRGKAENEAKVI
jgi:hypothetical protein